MTHWPQIYLNCFYSSLSIAIISPRKKRKMKKSLETRKPWWCRSYCHPKAECTSVLQQAVCHPEPARTPCSPHSWATPPACLLSHPAFRSRSLINTHLPLPCATPHSLSWTRRLPENRTAHRTPLPSMMALVLTGFAFFCR